MANNNVRYFMSVVIYASLYFKTSERLNLMYHQSKPKGKISTDQKVCLTNTIARLLKTFHGVPFQVAATIKHS